VQLKTLQDGKIQIGYVNDKCNIAINWPMGVGNDPNSWGFDGTEQSSFHGNTSGNYYGNFWCQGDVVGVVLDCDLKMISYFINGEDMGPAFTNVQLGEGLIPALSVNRNQSVFVNFGKSPFAFPIPEFFPDISPFMACLKPQFSKQQTDSLESLFEKYRLVHDDKKSEDEKEDTIMDNGFLQLSKDLGINGETDPIMLIVSWKLNVHHEKAWEINKVEWMEGWKTFGCSDIPSMKKKKFQIGEMILKIGMFLEVSIIMFLII